MRFAKTRTSVHSTSNPNTVNIGYGATVDCAILVAAQELGLFHKYGLKVHLSREVGWTTIREKLVHGELNLAATHASMLFSIYCGLGGMVRRPCLSAMLLGRNGSGITLTSDLWRRGVRDAASLAKLIGDDQAPRHFTFGVVHELSSQNLNLRTWLRGGGIDPDRDVRIVVIPSALMPTMMTAGYLDGYCVAEPWNSAALRRGNGWIAAATSEVSPNHPEKLLLALQDFADKREDEHLRIIAAMIEASLFCDQPGNRAELARMLANPNYFDTDKALLTKALKWQFEMGHSRPAIQHFVVYDALKVGAPTHAIGKWVYELVRELSGNDCTPALRSEIIPTLFREDLFHKAASLLNRADNNAPALCV
ncbi:MAG: CmpA/NrtA family ABC transporter substrate-binding protein [Chthoniobacteraceae bacterium]|nr:CmpA/NrtA family ABC transporter substrate-binding protein [Chthoniobacteraceae bacterium]